jgi:hypothetical protein
LAGTKVAAGDPITTRKSGIVTGDFKWGGVKSFSVLPSSSLQLDVYGNRPKGGRFTQFSVTGEALIEVLTVNPFTEVRVCFRNRWGRAGCSVLKSSVRVAPLPHGEQIVAVTEGNVTVQDEAEIFSPIALLAGQYSILKEDGHFTPAQDFANSQGYRIGVYRSKTIAVFEASPGWRFCNGETTFQAAIGTRLCVRGPAFPSL